VGDDGKQNAECSADDQGGAKASNDQAGQGPGRADAAKAGDEALEGVAREVFGKAGVLTKITFKAGAVDEFEISEAADCLVTQYQVFVQVGQVIFSLTGMVEENHRESYLPVFEAAQVSACI
jgi:hypothetical protein